MLLLTRHLADSIPKQKMGRLPRRTGDKELVSFGEQAQQLLDAATAAAAHGQPRSDLTILLGVEGGIRMIADSDWSLASLSREHGARAAYRIIHRDGSIRVEGVEGPKTCVLETKPSTYVMKLLLQCGR
jgi:hypothetical protein